MSPRLRRWVALRRATMQPHMRVISQSSGLSSKRLAPQIVFLGPGSVGEGISLAPPSTSVLKTKDLLKATGPVFDVFSYHSYGAVSKRCAGMGRSATISSGVALSQEWLSRVDRIEAFYADLRDQFEPGKPLWITE